MDEFIPPWVQTPQEHWYWERHLAMMTTAMDSTVFARAHLKQSLGIALVAMAIIANLPW